VLPVEPEVTETGLTLFAPEPSAARAGLNPKKETS